MNSDLPLLIMTDKLISLETISDNEDPSYLFYLKKDYNLKDLAEEYKKAYPEKIPFGPDPAAFIDWIIDKGYGYEVDDYIDYPIDELLYNEVYAKIEKKL